VEARKEKMKTCQPFSNVSYDIRREEKKRLPSGEKNVE